jgi:catechol 2,3-dioxygenase-like lactoylglutathione lyase family enzyme
MSPNPTHVTALSTVVVPVTDQDRSVAFYVQQLGMEQVLDATYPTGERWVEVAPPGTIISLCLVSARPERPAGIETGIVLASSDVLADLAALRASGVRTDDAPLEPGVVVWWSGAPLAGHPTQFRVWDPDGNSLLIVAGA